MSLALWPSQSTRKSPEGAPATAGVSSWQVVHELTRNGAARGPAQSDAEARQSAPPTMTAFLIEDSFPKCAGLRCGSSLVRSNGAKRWDQARRSGLDEQHPAGPVLSG